MDELGTRLEALLVRLRTAYDGIGHSYGRPYIYFVYRPAEERALRKLADETLRSDQTLRFHHLDLLPLTIASIAGQEERRQELLAGPRGGAVAGQILGHWVRTLGREIDQQLIAMQDGRRPVVVLRGLAALHPLSHPTAMMEALAEQEPRDAETGRTVPLVALVPGVRPPQTSREYLFLGQERLRFTFYRGEEW
ncbi:MAG: hypothetical protein M1296_07035 [Chloroflexi bacterium]|nr:hypothetical protein [Chloroflexota bacterium]